MFKNLFFNNKRSEIDNLFKKGLEFRDKKDYKQAEAFLNEALKKDPESEIIKLKLWQVKRLSSGELEAFKHNNQKN